MSKIYSRPRIEIKLPKLHFNNMRNRQSRFSKNSKENKKIIKIIVVCVIAILTIKIILDSVFPVFDRICEEKAKAIATIISNEQATKVMKEHEYEELFTLEKDSKGNIIMVKSNVGPINKIISDVGQRIQTEINNKGKENINIPLGNFTGFKLFAGKGPDIKIKITSVGNVDTDLKSEFSSQGINQTLHRVYLQVDCEVSILTPYNSIDQNISNQILIAENVILGNVPSTYYNIDTNNVEESMEFIE